MLFAICKNKVIAVQRTAETQDNDTLTVIPENSIILTDRSKISSMQADISQQKTVFMKEDGVASRATVNGSIQVDRSNFAGIWKGHFNFDIKFKMQN